MTDAEGANHPIAPDLGMIATFAKVLFDYSEGWVAVRAFPEKGDASQPARTPFVAADAELPTKLVAEAEAAAKKGLALYVVAGTVSGPGKAKAGDVIAIEAVLVDLDHGDVSAKPSVRRFTRLTNGFSKKVEKHAYAVALHMMYYNFIKLHSTLRVTPAMAAGVTDRLWEVSDIVALWEGVEPKAGKRGPYKKQISD